MHQAHLTLQSMTTRTLHGAHAAWCGAHVLPEYQPTATHVVVTHMEQTIVEQARHDGIPVVNVNW